MYCKSIRSPQRSRHTAQLSVSGQPHEGLLITYANFHFPLFQLHILCLPRVMCSRQNHSFLDWMQDVISQWTSNSIQAGLFKVNYQERTLLRVFICPIIAPCNRPQFPRNANLLKHAPLLHSSLRKDLVWCVLNTLVLAKWFFLHLFIAPSDLTSAISTYCPTGPIKLTSKCVNWTYLYKLLINVNQDNLLS